MGGNKEEPGDDTPAEFGTTLRSQGFSGDAAPPTPGGEAAVDNIEENSTDKQAIEKLA